jgi:hypothetical protein
MRPVRVLAACAVFLLPGLTQAGQPRTYEEGAHGRGRLQYIHGIPVLTVAGTPEEMGEQIGTLTAKPLKRLTEYPREMVKRLGLGLAWTQIVRLSNSMWPQFPADYRREVEAIAKHSGIDRDLVVLGNTLPDLMKIAGCSALIVEPARSEVDGPLFGRNLDYPTHGFLHRYTLVTVYHPKGKHAFASVGFPGMVGVLSGMNDAGLAAATLEVYRSKDKSPWLDMKGVPYTLSYRRVLEECATLAEAEKLLRSLKRTTMNNLAACDRRGGAVFELTSRSLVVRNPINDLCACTNHFRTPDLAAATASQLCTVKHCRRYAALVDNVFTPAGDTADQPKLGLKKVARRLHAANQGSLTLQTMIFEPAALRLHLAFGETPSSALPMHVLELGKLFGEGKRASARHG